MGASDLFRDEVLSLLPQIMQRLRGDRPLPVGLRALTPPQLRALATIAFNARGTMGELARALHVTLGAATGLVDRLLQQGLVARLPDPRDRRLVRLQLTEAGRRAHLTAVRRRRRRMGFALARLSPEQCGQVVTALRLLRDALGDG